MPSTPKTMTFLWLCHRGANKKYRNSRTAEIAIATPTVMLRSLFNGVIFLRVCSARKGKRPSGKSDSGRSPPPCQEKAWQADGHPHGTLVVCSGPSA